MKTFPFLLFCVLAEVSVLCYQFVSWTLLSSSSSFALASAELSLTKLTGCYLWEEIHANIIHDRGEEAVCSISATSIFNDVDFSGGGKQIRTHRERGRRAVLRPPCRGQQQHRQTSTHTHTHTHRHTHSRHKHRESNPC